MRLLLIVCVLLAACVVAWALLRSRRRDGPMVMQARPLPSMKGSLDAEARRGVTLELGEEIYTLLEAGRHAEAVARVREVSGWDAEEAERMVAKLETLKRRLES